MIEIERISALLKTREPAAVGKIGGTEGNALAAANSLFTRLFRRKRLYRRMFYLYERSGVFPHQPEMFFRFTEFFGNHVLPEADLLCHWRGKDDDWVKRRYKLKADWLSQPALGRDFRWLDGVREHRFVVLTPFVSTVRAQLSRLDRVWGREFSLGEHNVRLVECPHYAHLVPPRDSDWFTALDRLTLEMNRESYDVALIGAGAWSLPLAVRAKQNGRVGVHLGGQLQRVFGITGGRWENQDTQPNEHWVRVLPEDTPPTHASSSKDFRNDCAYW
jgi:hypothetical protein